MKDDTIQTDEQLQWRTTGSCYESFIQFRNIFKLSIFSSRVPSDEIWTGSWTVSEMFGIHHICCFSSPPVKTRVCGSDGWDGRQLGRRQSKQTWTGRYYSSHGNTFLKRPAFFFLKQFYDLLISNQAPLSLAACTVMRFYALAQKVKVECKPCVSLKKGIVSVAIVEQIRW